ncbi:protein kinase domain-containing protein [Actinoplanes sp. CA-054009]
MTQPPISILAGRYKLVSPLGQGGMGKVWKAHDQLLGRDVALKEIAPDGVSADELGDLRERAIREARAIARIDHPHVVRIFDVVEHEGSPWIVMELIRARSLFDVVNEDGPLEPARAARIGLDVLGALQAAHRAGILHRDVKPANVLVGANGRVVLTDFGLAMTAGDSAMTRTGVMLGSPSYLAPERAHDEPASAKSDLWSLGATLFAAVEGKPPYQRSSPMTTLAALMVDPPAAPERAGLLAPVLEALLEKDPAARASAEEAEDLLRYVLEQKPAAPPTTPTPATPTPATPSTPSQSPTPQPTTSPAVNSPATVSQPATPPAATSPAAASQPATPPAATSPAAASTAAGSTAAATPPPAAPAAKGPAASDAPTANKAPSDTKGPAATLVSTTTAAMAPSPRRRRVGVVVGLPVIAVAVAAASAAAVLANRGPQESVAQPLPSWEASGVPALPAAVAPSRRAPVPPPPSAIASSAPSRRPSATPSKSARVTAQAAPSKTPAAVRTTTPAAPKPTPLKVSFEAESYTDNSGTEDSFPDGASGGRVVGKTDNGDYVGYANHSLAGVHRVTLRYAAGDGDTDIEIRAGSASGVLMAHVTLADTGNFQTYATTTAALATSSSGALYLVFRGPKASDIDVVTMAG